MIAKDIVLICDSFSSANFYVMTTVIRSLDKSIHIHAIADTNEDKDAWHNADDITYYPIHSWRIDLINRLHCIRPKAFSRIIESIFFRVTNHINNFHETSYEKEMYNVAKKVILTNDVKSVFSVCFRFYNHRIALKLFKELKIKWFQFWLDPYSNRYDQHSLVWRVEAEALERRFFNGPDIIYALPEVFRGNRIIHSYKDKLCTFQIPYLIDRKVSKVNNNIIFAGSFVKTIREPEPMFNLLLTILPQIDPEVTFGFFVPDSSLYQAYTDLSQGRLWFHNYVSHDKLYEILAQCNMLLNMGNYGTRQMPSKTVEYVSFRKPILFFYRGVEDSSLGYLSDYPDVCRIDIDGDYDQNVIKLIDFIRREHREICYEELIKKQSFYESTPEYLRQVIKLS